MDEVTLIAGGGELLERIEPLWLELRAHHAALSPTWREGLLSTGFEERRRELLSKAKRGLHVVLAHRRNAMVGYCISTLADNGQGEVDSIYVTAVVRGRGIGKQLMQDAMAWLRERGAHPIVVEVMAGNVAAEKLYESFGFSARTVRMRYVGEEP